VSTERDPLTLATEALARHNFDLDWGGDASFEDLAAKIKRSWLSEALAQAKVVAEHFQPRTVTTVEELDALGFEAVVIDPCGTPAVCQRSTREFCDWALGGSGELVDSATLLMSGSSCTVLHEGQA